METTVSISQRRIITTLIIVVLFLTFASITAMVWNTISVHGYFFREMRETFYRLFSLNLERNIPTWYAASTLLFCSILLAGIAYVTKMVEGPHVRRWWALSIIFLCLSIDEAVVIHEMGSKLVNLFISTGGFLLYSWVILGAVFVFTILLLYIRFLADLPKTARLQFLIAGVVYVAGALVVESISAYFADSYGPESIGYHIIFTIEEFFEMAGVIIFIYALLSYLNSIYKGVQIRLED